MRLPLLLLLVTTTAAADTSLPDGEGARVSQCEAALRLAVRKAGMEDAHEHLTRDGAGLRFHYRISDRCGVQDDYEARITPTRAGDERWRTHTSRFDSERPGRTTFRARRVARGWEAAMTSDIGDFTDRTAEFKAAFRPALDRCLSEPPSNVAPDAVICSHREWLALKHAAIRDCRGDLCADLKGDLETTVFCDGEDKRTPENRDRCDARSMRRENPERCEKVAPGRYRINVDCWGWEVSYAGGTVSSVQGTGNCD